MDNLLATDEDILDALCERSEADNAQECDNEEDFVETEEYSDEYDSDADPEYVPDNDDLLELEENTVRYVRQIELQEEVVQPRKISKKLKAIKTPSKKGRAKKSYNDEVASEEERVCRINGEDGLMIGSNGFIWGVDCDTVAEKTPGKNIVHIRPGPTIDARQAESPFDCFKLFFSANIVQRVLEHTNEEISLQKQKYSVQDATVSETCEEELYALFRIIVLGAALKDNDLSTNLMFDNSYCGDRYKTTMSERRFKFLINCLRFDNRATRDTRKDIDKSTAISEIWHMLLENCRNNSTNIQTRIVLGY